MSVGPGGGGRDPQGRAPVSCLVLGGRHSQHPARLNARDFPPFQGTVLVIGFIIVTVNLAVDLTYAWIDPRIRYT